MEINPIASLKKLTVSHSGKISNEPSLLDIECEGDEFDVNGNFSSFFYTFHFTGRQVFISFICLLSFCLDIQSVSLGFALLFLNQVKVFRTPGKC